MQRVAFTSWFVTLMVTGIIGCGSSDASFDDPQVMDASGGDDASPDAATDEIGDAPGDETTVDDATQPEDVGATSDGGGEASPTADAPAGDTGAACPTGTTTKPATCPALCNAGCDGDLCKITCEGISSCNARRIDCPPGMKCRVACTGINSCGSLDLRCADTGACELVCNATSACASVKMRCPTTAPCKISCQQTSACNGGEVQCGQGACDATCSGVGTSLSKVDCGASCKCTNKC